MNEEANKLRLGSRGLALIKAFESFCPHPYDDALPMVRSSIGKPEIVHGTVAYPLVNPQYREWTGGLVRGTLTIGYGHTEAAGLPRITKGMRLSQEAAAILLDADLDMVEFSVRKVVIWPLEQHEFDALVSFHFNCHGLILKSGDLSTCCRRLNAGRKPEAMHELEKWNHHLGQVSRGLVRRRAAERALFEGRFEDAETLMHG